MRGELKWSGSVMYGLTAALTVGLAACGDRVDSDLFSPQQIMSGQGSATGEGGSAGLAASGGGASASGGGAGQSAGTGGVSGGGSSGDSGGGAAGGGMASGGSASGGAASGGAGGGAAGSSTCSDLGGVELAETGHCYVLHEESLDWHAAQQHCESDGGYLVTIGSEAENDLLWELLDDQKWIGATDGRPPSSNSAGEYEWVTGEPMDYVNWTFGQPNAALQTCPPGSGPSLACYEHCAYQWNPEGFENEGEWNDQGCWLGEAFVCEHE